MDLKEVVSRIEQFSPPSLAGSWDNVGLLIEPEVPMHINKIVLTNDLTEDVMKECVKLKRIPVQRHYNIMMQLYNHTVSASQASNSK